MGKFVAIGDLHGCPGPLIGLTDYLAQHHRDATLVFLGDYVDYGQDSRGVIEHILTLARKKVFRGMRCMRGNHDEMMLDALRNPGATRSRMWIERSGGAATIRSYGGVVHNDLTFDVTIPPHHFAFLKILKSSFMINDLFFCHAGVNPEKPLDEQSPRDLAWIRDRFNSAEVIWPKTIVHGHTLNRSTIEVSPRNTLNVDTGSHRTGIVGAAVLYPGKAEYSTLTSDGRSVLEYQHANRPTRNVLVGLGVRPGSLTAVQCVHGADQAGQ